MASWLCNIKFTIGFFKNIYLHSTENENAFSQRLIPHPASRFFAMFAYVKASPSLCITITLYRSLLSISCSLSLSLSLSLSISLFNGEFMFLPNTIQLIWLHFRIRSPLEMSSTHQPAYILRSPDFFAFFFVSYVQLE